MILPLLLSIVSVAWAAETVSADKSGYTLFHPTPRDLMREFSTDRPDKTESPHTVDAGHFQFEAEAVSYVHDRNERQRLNAIGFGNLNLKLGLLNDLDFQAVFGIYNSVRAQDTAGAVEDRRNGVGDLILRLKYALFGNDGGEIAMAFMPFVKFPTNTGGVGNKKVEGGIIAPIGLKLPRGFDLTTMFQINKQKNESNENYHTVFISSAAMSHELIHRLGMYAEIYSETSNEAGSDWVATFDVGLTWEPVEDLQFDGGVNLGLTDAANTVNPFIGISKRF